MENYGQQTELPNEKQESDSRGQISTDVHNEYDHSYLADCQICQCVEVLFIPGKRPWKNGERTQRH